MEAQCDTCKTVQKKFYCVDCLQKQLNDYRLRTQRATSERDIEVQKASRFLTSTENRRRFTAEQSRLNDSIAELKTETASAQKRNEDVKRRIAALRESVTSRRRQLHRAITLTKEKSRRNTGQSDKVSILQRIQLVSRELEDLQSSLASTRKVLIRSLIEAFDLRESEEVPSSPTSYGKLVMDTFNQRSYAATASIIAGAGMNALFGRSTGMTGSTSLPKTKPVLTGEWSVAGIILPVPGDLRRHPPSRINAALNHTLHFVQLLTFYLGIKLPFEVAWTGKLPGVGVAYLAAGRGTETGGWASWTAPCQLHLPKSSSSVESGSQPPGTSPADREQQFLTALCMLNYNIAYLCHTQGIEIPLNATGETLRNLALLCQGGEDVRTSTIGQQARTPGPSRRLPAPTGGFNLDFSQVLQIVSAHPLSAHSSRRRHSSMSGTLRPHPSSRRPYAAGGDIADGWDLVEVEEGNDGVG